MTPPLPDPTACPRCSARLDGSAACPACGLGLTGPAAVRLYAVDGELLALDAARSALLIERAALLAELDRPPAAAAPAAQGDEAPPRRVADVLLALGGLLLAVAAVVFAAVTYSRLGAGGRSLVLLGLTAAAALAAPLAVRRGLASTAETLCAVALVLAALDAYGLRTLGIGAGLAAPTYAALSAGAVAGLAAAYGDVVPCRLPRAAAVVLAQLPLPLVLLEHEASAPVVATGLAALAGADLAVVAGRRRPAVVGRAAGACAAAVGLLALLVAGGSAVEDGTAADAGALLAVGVVPALAAALCRTAPARAVLSALPVALLAAAALGLAEPRVAERALPLVAAVVALAAASAALLLPVALRTGPGAGAAVVAGLAVAAVVPDTLLGLVGPLTWATDPWTLADRRGARAAVSLDQAWTGTPAVPVVLLAVAAVGLLVAPALRRAGPVLPARRLPGLDRAVAAGLAAAALGLVPVVLDLPHPAAVALLGALGGAGLLLPRVPLPARLLGGGGLLVAVAWSLADREVTLAALPVAALVLVVAAVPLRGAAGGVLAGAAGLLAAGEVGAVGAAAGLAHEQVGGLLLLPLAVLLAVALPALGRERRHGVELAAVVTASVGVLMAADDPGWASWSLAGTGLLALATALRPDRRRVAVAGGLLLAASSWVRLAEAGVGAPEPYVVPVAVAVLVLGHLRRRAEPGTSSFAAYGTGLVGLLVPSLLDVLSGGPLLRALLLAGAALAVVLVGARARLRAPLAVGGGVLALDALQLLAPYAAALPRWLVLGAAGALLVAVGATYERRLRDVVRLRERYDALA